MKRWLFILGLAAMAGCARFEPKPLAPAETAARVEQRTLDENHLGRDPKRWPQPRWNLAPLTPAASYDQPGLDVARAPWIVSAHGGLVQIASLPANAATVTIRLPLITTI